MADLEGTHGTSFSRARKIQAEGFQLTAGLAGQGCYFWRAGRQAINLAISWYNFQRSNGTYATDPDPDCAIISVELSVSPAEHLDMELQSVKDGLDELAERKNIGDSVKEIAILIATFVAELEEKLSTKYKVLELRVPPPPQKFQQAKIRRIMGWPLCYVAREPSCIEIVKIRRIRDENHTN